MIGGRGGGFGTVWDLLCLGRVGLFFGKEKAIPPPTKVL